ncbi:MAG: class I SAM-dependent methyltransferase [Bryobacterales bacterium]|nr:class I SAM-dependent methyltransferase [Bryobacterales bacterium]
MPGTQNKPYRLLAEYYDQLFTAHLPFEDARADILNPLLGNVTAVCDLACGTGATAVSFAKQGFRTYAVDLSPNMCRLTREKAKRAGVKVKTIRADMRRFRLPEPVELMLCEFDALNHVPSKNDLPLVLQCVAQALRPGGHFYFDVNMIDSFKQVWPLSYFTEAPGVALTMHGGYDRKTGKAWSDLEWFIQEGKLWRREREHFEEVCWSGKEMRTALKNAGFDAIRSWDATKFFLRDNYMKPGYRNFYLARKAA